MSRSAHRIRWLVLALLLTSLPTAASGRAAREEEGGPGQSTAARPGVLVELFTSQGCSSCPSADRFLSELANRKDLDVIALSFHVDYWNYIGWTDPFSSAEWSERQRRYAKALGGDRIYTPQMVVAGRWEGVGSHRAKITGLLERAREAQGRLEIELSAKLVSSDRLRVAVRADPGPPAGGREELDLWVAVCESDLVTPVGRGRGENASKTLRNDRVVRHLEALDSQDASGKGLSGLLEIPLDEGWRRDKLHVVAFVQEAGSLRVRAVVESSLAR